MDKRGDEITRDCSTHSDSSLYPTYSTMLCSTLSTDKLRECLAYKHYLNTYCLGVAPSPDGPLPRQWVDFLNEQDTIMTSVRVLCCYPINPGRLSNQCRTGADRCTPTLPR